MVRVRGLIAAILVAGVAASYFTVMLVQWYRFSSSVSDTVEWLEGSAELASEPIVESPDSWYSTEYLAPRYAEAAARLTNEPHPLKSSSIPLLAVLKGRDDPSLHRAATIVWIESEHCTASAVQFKVNGMTRIEIQVNELREVEAPAPQLVHTVVVELDDALAAKLTDAAGSGALEEGVQTTQPAISITMVNSNGTESVSIPVAVRSW